MQRFSNRRGDKQLHQQEVADVAIQKFVSAGLIPPPPPQHQQQHQPKQPQRRQGGLNPEEREQYLSSRPVSPLIAPSVKARPSSVAEKGNLKIGGRSSNTANNNTQPDSFENNVVNDTRPQSPISFLDSPGPLIQAQEQATGSIETVTSPSSTNQAVAAVSATAAATALVRKGSHSPFHVTLTTSRSVSSINTATPGPSPDNLETYSAFNHQENQHLHISDKSPTDRADKKKRNWFSWGSKESSNTIEQKQSKALHQQEQQQLQQLQQPISKPKSNSHRGHLPRHPFTTAPKVLQKKKRPVGTKESTQIHQHPLPTNNSPEPSFSSKFTDEEQDLNEDYSEVPKNTIDNTTTRERQSQLTLADQQGESPSQPSLDYRDPDSERSLKTASSHSHQPEIGGLQKPAPSWESRLRQGSTNHQRAASTDERNTVQSAGASAQTNRAELKYRDDRLVPTSRPSSRQSIDPPSPSESGFNQLIHSRTNSSQNKNNQAKGYMGGSTNQQHFLGRNGEPQNNSGNREVQYGSTLSVNNQQAPGSYKNTPLASPMVQDNSILSQGRITPPPAANANKSREDLGSADMQQLTSKHDELNEKYRKVKKYYFDKDAQVQQLQNQLAYQRLSQSRTNLDDSDYATRFGRLDGAINNLAFNIRKDWRAVPSWLAHCVNKDATTIVTKEMTAVGRACISRWLVDEVFDRYFHPGLEPHLSCQLKVIEKNIRRFLPSPATDEERENLVAKMSNWRLSTLDGLKSVLDSEACREAREELTKMLVTMLTGDLKDNLKEPPPPGLDAGVIGIIELAVGIAANIPYESRDIFVDYLMPGVPVNDSIMKVEAVLPILTNPGDGPVPENDRRTSVDSLDDKSDDMEFGKDGNQKKKGILGGIMGGGRGKNKDTQPKEERVRFAAFMLVEVRGGKSVLVKAPVYV